VNYIDFAWLTNAFIIDEVANALLARGYTNGYVSSYEGYVRYLDAENNNYSINLNNRQEKIVYPAGVAQCKNIRSLVQLRNYPINASNAANYYAYSDNGENPPIDLAVLTISKDGMLVFGDENITLTVNDKILSVDELFSLNVFDNELSGSGSEWSQKIPAVPPGNYLWVKTVFSYSDGTSTIQYISSYQGKNGEKGPVGDRGEDAN
jgi:hypothetical protein